MPADNLTPLDVVIGALAEKSPQAISEQLDRLHPAEIANLLEALPHDDRDPVWELIDVDTLGEVLAEVEDQIRAARMLQMQPQALARTAQTLDVDDAVDILQDLPEQVMEEVLRSMDAQNRSLLETALAYPEDTAGGLMAVEDFIAVRADVTLEVVLRYLRAKGEIPEKTDRLVVVDRDNRYQGMLRLAGLLINPSAVTVAEIMEVDVPGIPVMTPSHDVATMFEQRDLISAAVVDETGCMLGRITIDDVVDVIRDEGEHDLMSMAGMDEHYDMFAPVLVTSRRRALWLGVNLATALAGLLGDRFVRGVVTGGGGAGYIDAGGGEHGWDCRLASAHRCDPWPRARPG